MTSEDLENSSIRDILQKIRDGVFDPLLLPKATRLACVEVLLLEGTQQSVIAQFLKKSDRTIRRDIEEIRKNYKVNPSPELTKSILTDFLFHARIHHTHLMKLARSSDSSAGDKSKAEALAWKVSKEVLQELYYIGFLIMSKEVSKEKPKESNIPNIFTEKEIEMVNSLGMLDAMTRESIAERLTSEILKLVDEKSHEKAIHNAETAVKKE